MSEEAWGCLFDCKQQLALAKIHHCFVQGCFWKKEEKQWQTWLVCFQVLEMDLDQGVVGRVSKITNHFTTSAQPFMWTLCFFFLMLGFNAVTSNSTKTNGRPSAAVSSKTWSGDGRVVGCKVWCYVPESQVLLTWVSVI